MAMPPISMCPACLSQELSEALECDGFRLARCGHCSHLFVAVEVPDEILASAYGAEYYGGANKSEEVEFKGYTDYLGNMSARLATFRGRMDAISLHTTSTGRLLDYGCAVGLFVKAATERGWQAVGYERSDWAVRYGREQLGLDIRLAKPRENPFEPGTFDVVTLWDVAEHLAHPRDVLLQAHDWLRPGGILALNTVNSSSLGARLAGRAWRHIAPPWHLQYFTRKSLTRLLIRIGFEYVSSTGEGSVMESTGRPIIPGAAFVERALQHWRVRGIASALNLFDEIMIIARKSR